LWVDSTCQLPAETGRIRCMAYIPRWYYDAKKKRCAFFVYGGCRGTANNFRSWESCAKRCLKPDVRGS